MTGGLYLTLLVQGFTVVTRFTRFKGFWLRGSWFNGSNQIVER